MNIVTTTTDSFFLPTRKHLKIICLLLTLLAISSTELRAETGLATLPASNQEPSHSSPTFMGDTNFVLVSDINNPADQNTDATGKSIEIGSVSEPFAIAKYDVTASEYQEFLEATESTDVHGVYHPEMNSDPAVACLTRTAAEDGIHYGVIAGRENFPITYVAWPDAIRYCNWLQHGKPTRDKVSSDTTETGAYIISTDDTGNTIYTLQTNALYFLPSQDQWHKAAYYRHDIKTYWTYPTGCNMAPGNSLTPGCANEANYRTGDLWNSYCTKTAPYLTTVGIFSDSAGPYGTFDMGGNVNQWTGDFDENDHAIALGGSWKSQYSYYYINDLENTSPGQHRDPSQGYNDIGFRIAGSPDLVPSPALVDYSNSSNVDFGEIGKIAAENGMPEILEWIGYGLSMNTTTGLLSFLGIYTSAMSARIWYDMHCQDYTAAGILMAHMASDLVWMSAPLFFSEEGIASFLEIVKQCFGKLGLEIIPAAISATGNLVEGFKDFIAESFISFFNLDNNDAKIVINATST